MAVLHRALFTWFNLLIFLILLVLRLDHRIQWNWFIVFIPMWLYDSILLIYILFNMISHCKNGHDRASSLRRKVRYTKSAFKLSTTNSLSLSLTINSSIFSGLVHDCGSHKTLRTSFSLSKTRSPAVGFTR